MEHAQHHPAPAEPRDGRPGPADRMGVSADELIEMIQSGQGLDVNELVGRTLDDRRAP